MCSEYQIYVIMLFFKVSCQICIPLLYNQNVNIKKDIFSLWGKSTENGEGPANLVLQ